MKKTFNRFCFFTLITAFFLCLTSCFNLFSRNCDNDDEATACFTGYINVDSILGSDFVISDNTQRSARPEPITVDGTTYEYNIQALRTKNEVGETYLNNKGYFDAYFNSKRAAEGDDVLFVAKKDIYTDEGTLLIPEGTCI